jgi:hypothetical protein
LRPFKPALGLILLVVVVSGLWVAVRALVVAHQIREAEAGLDHLQAQASHGEPLTGLTSVQTRLRKADGASHDLAWKVWSHVPLVGHSVTLVAGMSATSHQVSVRALPALLGAAEDAPHIRRADGSFESARLSGRRDALDQADLALQAAVRAASALPGSRLGALDAQRIRLLKQLRRISSSAHSLAVASDVCRELLGENGSRRYLVLIQNNAESRASGGIVGAYGIVEASQGRMKLVVFGADTDLRPASANVVDLGREWHDRYDALGQARDWREVTSSPHFPTVARAALGLWSATHDGQKLDGVLSLDAPGMADVLRATGPVSTALGVLTERNFLQVTLADVYKRLPQKAQRTAAQTASAKSVVSALLHGAGSTTVLGESLGHAIVGRHLQFYSVDTRVQARIATTALAGVLPSEDSTMVSVITQDANNDKLSYYLQRRITYVSESRLSAQDVGSGPKPQEAGTLTVTLQNSVPTQGLPQYVAPSLDATTGRPIAPGTMHVALSVYLGHDGFVSTATIDGRPTSVSSQTEQGLAVVSVSLWLAPGSRHVVQFQTSQPFERGSSLTLVPQPLARADSVSIRTR